MLYIKKEKAVYKHYNKDHKYTGETINLSFHQATDHGIDLKANPDSESVTHGRLNPKYGHFLRIPPCLDLWH